MIKTGGENVASREVEEGHLPASGCGRGLQWWACSIPKWVEAVAAVIKLKAGTSTTEEEMIAPLQGQSLVL